MKPEVSPGLRWLVVGVAAFILIDAALVWWALSAARGTTAQATPLPMSAFAPAPTSRPATPVSRPAPTPTPTLAPIVLEPMARRIVPLSADQAWRTSSVACGAPTTIDWTGDGGATWTSWSAGDDVWGVSEIVGYTGDPSMVGIVAMVAGDCRQEYRISFTSGEFWAPYPGDQPDTVTIDPADAATLRGPVGAVGSPCGPVSEFALGTTSVGILCTSTDVRVGPLDMSSWGAVAVSGSTVAITASGDGFLVAARRDPACIDGVQLSRIGTDGALAPGVCLPGQADQTVPVALGTADDGSIWLWIGELVRVSSDGGTTWTGG